MLGAPGAVAGTPDDFFEALVAYLLADAGLMAALPGGVSADDGVVGDVLPYAVLSEQGFDTLNESATSTPNGIDTGQVQVMIFAEGKALARSLRRRAVAAIQDVPLAFATGTLIYLRDAGPLPATKDPDLGPNGVDVWVETLVFDVVIGR